VVNRLTKLDQEEVNLAKVTLQTIADDLNISKSLVSKIINNREVRISDDLRKQILDRVEYYNYVPNRAASALSSKKMYLIACIVINTNYHFYSELVFQVEKYAFKHGYNVVLCNVAEDVDRERKYLEMYSSGLFDGILVATSDGISNIDIFKRIHKEGFPIVFVDRYIPDIGISVVATDNYYGSYVLTKELIQRGHKDIDFLGYGFADKTIVQKERYNGYAAAMAGNGLKSRLVYTDDKHKNNLDKIFQSEKDRPTALVMISSWVIEDVLSLCRKFDIKISRDLSLATFDEFSIPFNSMVDIQNTRVVEEPILILRQDTKRIATTAVDVLLKKIAGDTGVENTQEFILPYFK
jgi:LacI family transcriptional regulator